MTLRNEIGMKCDRKSSIASANSLFCEWEVMRGVLSTLKGATAFSEVLRHVKLDH
jgi:hypothetical protein